MTTQIIIELVVLVIIIGFMVYEIKSAKIKNDEVKDAGSDNAN